MSSILSQDPNKPFHRGEDPCHLNPLALSAHGLADYSPEIAATVSGRETHPPLDALFHPPPHPLSILSPRIFPGVDKVSTEALVKTLSDNHVRWHIFFNYKGFHNHAAHHMLAIWALGAPGPVVEAAYTTHCEYQRPAFAPPGPINIHNLYRHLGDERYYATYLDYFTSELLQKGLNKCFEEYIFAIEANFGSAQPEMLSRFMEGVLHPLIHTGYGAEFSSVGISAEGLALTTVQTSNTDSLPRAWFPDVISGGTTRAGYRTALSIVALVSCDPRFSQIKSMDEETMYSKTLTEHGSIIHNYVDMWKFDISTEEGIANAIEELAWANTVIYGVGGFSSDNPFNADFFLMHLVTSSIFLPSLLACIDKFSSRRLLLMAYFSASLSYYVARGCPPLDIRSFYKGTESLLNKVPGPIPEPALNTLPTPTSNLAHTPNAWYPIIQTTIVHPNEHLCKAQRALAHFSSLYGAREGGWCTPPDGRTVTSAQEAREEEAEDKVGLQELNGTIFLRVALLTQNKLGWMREGESAGSWDDKGFYWEGAVVRPLSVNPKLFQAIVGRPDEHHDNIAAQVKPYLLQRQSMSTGGKLEPVAIMVTQKDTEVRSARPTVVVEHTLPCSHCAERSEICTGPMHRTCEACAQAKRKCDKSRGRGRPRKEKGNAGPSEEVPEPRAKRKRADMVIEITDDDDDKDVERIARRVPIPMIKASTSTNENAGPSKAPSGMKTQLREAQMRLGLAETQYNRAQEDIKRATEDLKRATEDMKNATEDIKNAREAVQRAMEEM